MYFVASKVLQELIWPLNWTFAGLAAAFFFLRKDRARAGMLSLVATAAALSVFSSPLVATLMRRSLEDAYPSRPIAEYPEAGAIVVLGGSVAGVIPPRYEPEEVSGSRLLPAARLYRAGKAKLILVSSGYRYEGAGGVMRVDADDMKQVLVDMAVPAEAIVTETVSRTTRENAMLSARILKERGVRSVLLVTSAFHIRRAAGWFKAEGLEIIPVPVSREVAGVSVSPWSFWPSAGALNTSTICLKEIVGHLINPN